MHSTFEIQGVVIGLDVRKTFVNVKLRYKSANEQPTSKVISDTLVVGVLASTYRESMDWLNIGAEVEISGSVVGIIKGPGISPEIALMGRRLTLLKEAPGVAALQDIERLDGKWNSPVAAEAATRLFKSIGVKNMP